MTTNGKASRLGVCIWSPEAPLDMRIDMWLELEPWLGTGPR